jgi:hypothetical protein
MLIKSLLIIKNVFLVVTAHVFMKEPISRHSKYSSYYTENNLINYNLNSPLNIAPDFFQFPCKGFNRGPVTTEIYDNRVKTTLEGQAIHEGGHCQFGITYDEKTFLVIKTIYNNCLINSMTYDIELPDNIPMGQSVFFWTWINKIGNREYYMECADIFINNNNTNLDIELKGMDLLIVNLPGYPTLPEFPNSDNYNGLDLLESRKTITINPIIQTTSVSTPITQTTIRETTTKQISTRTTNIQISATPKKTSIPKRPNKNKDCKNGDMKCNGFGFNTCVWNKWVYRECADRTKCKYINISNTNTIICDYDYI